MDTHVNTAATRSMVAARRLVRALSRSARAVETSSGVSGAQLFILRQLASAAGPLSVNELAGLTLTHQSTVSAILNPLVERRLVTRTPAPDDARRMAIALTHRGRVLATTAPPTAQTQLVDGLARLPAGQRATLADALEAWLEAAGLAGEPAPLFFEHDRNPVVPRVRAAVRAGRRRHARAGRRDRSTPDE
jgi:DNA-binding MarR family transcriptional regulator